MKDLIERLEKATEPDQELDLAIAMACQIDCRQCCGHGVAVWAQDGNGIVGEECCGNPDVCPANYTASLDAALTLVPDGFRWKLGYSRHVPNEKRTIYDDPRGPRIPSGAPSRFGHQT